FIFFIVGPDPKPNQTVPSESKILCLILVLIYALSGWLLGSFVNGKLITLWQIFSFKREEPPSIFEKK
ncbi:MAG: hypothetical protein ABJA66_13870, partial [Actinomycetota bacterium]